MSDEHKTSSAEMLPCPKCGSTDIALDQMSLHGNRFVRFCNNCDESTATYEMAEEATAAWNSRPSPIPSEMVEAAERTIIDAIEEQFDIHALEPEDWAELANSIRAALSTLQHPKPTSGQADEGMVEAAYREGWHEGYATGDASGSFSAVESDWAGSDARAAIAAFPQQPEAGV